VSDVDEAPPVAEPTRWVRAWEAAVGGDDDESESESEEEAPPPPHKRRRTTKTAAAPRPRTSFLSKYYGVTFKKETKKWQVQYTDASGTQKWSGLFDDEEKAARAYNSLIVELGLESRRKINKVDAAGRLVEKPQPPPPIPEADRVSRYYGVSYHAGIRKFTAQVTTSGGKSKTIGVYLTQEEAAHAYNDAVESAGLASRRKFNKIDSAGRLIEKTKIKKLAPVPPSRRSRYYGVYYVRSTGNYEAQYRDARGKRHSIGTFKVQENAALAYNATVRRLGLVSRRKMNEVDSAGRLVEKPPKR